MENKEELKVQYLTLIQEPISRMSTLSSVFKGFTATAVVAISTTFCLNPNWWVLLTLALPILVFAALDIYYLGLERKFRYLFELVRSDKHEIDFSLKIYNDKKSVIAAKARPIDCIRSKSIWLFYLLMILIPIALLVLKLTGLLEGVSTNGTQNIRFI